MPATMNCPHCGTPLAPQDAFCGQCGRRIQPHTAPDPLPPRHEPTAAPAAPRTRPRKGPVVFAASVAALALAAGGLLAWPGHLLASGKAAVSAPTTSASGQVLTPGVAVPTGAANTAQHLVSGAPAQQRAALTTQLDAALSAGPLFPAGATLALDAMSWHQSGDYANATGVLSVPSQGEQRVEIGFVDRSGTWLVTFEEALP